MDTPAALKGVTGVHSPPERLTLPVSITQLMHTCQLHTLRQHAGTNTVSPVPRGMGYHATGHSGIIAACNDQSLIAAALLGCDCTSDILFSTDCATELASGEGLKHVDSSGPVTSTGSSDKSGQWQR